MKYILVCFLLLTSFASQANTLVSNLNNIQNISVNTFPTAVAQGIQVGTTDITFNQIDILLSNAVKYVTIYEGTTAPNSAVISRFYPHDAFTSQGIYRFSGMTTLQANKTYWLVAEFSALSGNSMLLTSDSSFTSHTSVASTLLAKGITYQTQASPQWLPLFGNMLFSLKFAAKNDTIKVPATHFETLFLITLLLGSLSYVRHCKNCK